MTAVDPACTPKAPPQPWRYRQPRLAGLLVAALLAGSKPAAVMAQPAAAAAPMAARTDAPATERLPADPLARARLLESTCAGSLGPMPGPPLACQLKLAGAYMAGGQSWRAVPLLRQVLQARSEAGVPAAHRVPVLRELTVALGHVGRLAEALEAAEGLLHLTAADQSLGPAEHLRAQALLASTYLRLGRSDDALALAEAAHTAARQRWGPAHPETLAQAAGLALAYVAVGRAADALPLEEAVLQHRQQTLGERHGLTLLALSNLGASLSAAGRYADARPLVERAYAGRRETLGPAHPSTLNSLSIFAGIEERLGRNAEAVKLYAQAYEQHQSTLGPGHPNTVQNALSLGRAQFMAGRPHEAVKLARPFVRGAEGLRRQVGLASPSRQALFRSYAQGYRFFSLVHGVVGDTARGWELAELGKARTLLDGINLQGAVRAGVLPADERARLETLQQQLSSLDEAVAQAGSVDDRRAVDARRNEAARQMEALFARLKAAHPRFAELSTPRLLAPAQWRGLVAPGTVAISYVQMGRFVAAWLLESDGAPRYVYLGTVPELATAVELLRLGSSSPLGLQRLLREEGRQAIHLAEGGYRIVAVGAALPAQARPVQDEAEVAAWLAQRLLQPLMSAVKGRPRWIVCPDGPLAQLPFELLPFEGGRVVDRVEVQYTQSLSVYAAVKERLRSYRSQAWSSDLLAIGNPDYGGDPDKAAGARARWRQRPLDSESQLAALRGSWIALPGTAQEVASIQALFQRSEVLTGAAASEERLQALQASGRLQQFRYVHVAAHGYLSPGDASLSSIVLSQARLPAGVDGYITAAEWPGYELRSELMVLSACDTGLGTQVAGEGVLGLPFALFVAGNVNTVLSLWPVIDDAAPEFMRRFYGKLAAGAAPSQALAEVKREMAASPEARWNHPSAWAPFVLVGAS